MCDVQPPELPANVETHVGPMGRPDKYRRLDFDQCDDDRPKYNFVPRHNLEWLKIWLTFS